MLLLSFSLVAGRTVPERFCSVGANKGNFGYALLDGEMVVYNLNGRYRRFLFYF